MKFLFPALFGVSLLQAACCKGVPPDIDTDADKGQPTASAKTTAQPAKPAAQPTATTKPTANAPKAGPATSAEIEEMFGNELDQIPANQQYVKTAAVEAAKIVGKNDAEAFIARLEDSFSLAGKRLSKDEAAAKIRADGLQATLKIVPLQGASPTPYGIGWRLTSNKSNVFAITSGSGYGRSWVLSCKAQTNGSFTILKVQEVDLGSP